MMYMCRIGKVQYEKLKETPMYIYKSIADFSRMRSEP